MALKTEEIEDVTPSGSRGCIAVAGVGLACHERRLKTEEVKDIECASSGGGVAVGIAGGCESEHVQAILADGVDGILGDGGARSRAFERVENEQRIGWMARCVQGIKVCIGIE